MEQKLNSGDIFPNLDLKRADGAIFNIPNSIDSKYLIVIFYRGHW